MMILDVVFLAALGLLLGIGWILDAGSRGTRSSATGGLAPSGSVE